MVEGDVASRCVLGFLSVLSHEQLGLVGGYLILNESGRPLEFHCTAPVKANRSQQILFGPTLQTYLYGEQIGQTLVAAGSAQPWAVFTDSERALAVRDFIAAPVGLVVSGDPTPEAARGEVSPWRHEGRTAESELHRFELGRNRLAVSPKHKHDESALVDRIAGVPLFDLAEPFVRIRQAIEESHRNTRAA